MDTERKDRGIWVVLQLGLTLAVTLAESPGLTGFHFHLCKRGDGGTYPFQPHRLHWDRSKAKPWVKVSGPAPLVCLPYRSILHGRCSSLPSSRSSCHVRDHDRNDLLLHRSHSSNSSPKRVFIKPVMVSYALGPALRRQKPVDLCEFEASQSYIMCKSEAGPDLKRIFCSS